MKPCCLTLAAAGALSFIGPCAIAAVIDFDSLSLAPNTFDFPPDADTLGGTGSQAPWTVGAATFNRYVDDEFASWGGFTFANGADSTTAGFSNQQSVVTGAAFSGSNFGLGYYDTFTPITPTITFSAGHYPVSLQVTNTTYAALYMQSGLDGFVDNPDNRFGGPSGSDPDFFLLSINGFDGANASTGIIDFYLADYRFANAADDYIRTLWNLIDLTPLGSTTEKLTFTLTSSDPFAPSYFAIDNLISAPEPTRSLLAGIALVFVLTRRRRHSVFA